MKRAAPATTQRWKLSEPCRCLTLLGWALLPAESRSDRERPRADPLCTGGPWSAPATWEGGKVPAAGSRVQIRPGHTVTYDLKSDRVIRSIHVAGTLRFAHDKDTRLDVGLIKIQPGDDASEDGFDCDAHAMELPAGSQGPPWRSAPPTSPSTPGTPP